MAETTATELSYTYFDNTAHLELSTSIRTILLRTLTRIDQDVEIESDSSDDVPVWDPVAAATLRQCIRRAKQVATTGGGSRGSEHVRKLATASERVRALLRRQKDRFLAVPWKEVPRAWRCCSTDATIVLVCAEVITLLEAHPTLGTSATVEPASIPFSPSTQQFPSRILSLIRTLDECLIVTGAPGEGRDDLIHHLIQTIQSLYKSLPSPDSGPTASTSDQTPEPAAKRARLAYKRDQLQAGPVRATHDVLELKDLPGLLDFLKNHIDRPFIVRDWAEHWPALQPDHGRASSEGTTRSRWSCGNYLTKLVGPGRVVPVEIGRAYTDAEWTQAIIPWDDFLQRAGWTLDPTTTTTTTTTHPHPSPGPNAAQDASRPPTTYLAQHTLLTQFPELEADMIRPDLVYSSPPAPAWMPEYRAPVNTEGAQTDDVVVNAWIGPEDTLSPAHTDPYYNLFVQVVGHKQFWLAPPEANQHGGMYQFSNDTDTGTDTGQAVSELRQSVLPASSQAAASYMDNTSQLDVFAPRQQSDGASEDPFPLFTKHVESLALKVVVGPGDLLYIPPMWWHAVRSLSKSISISHFF